MQAKNIRRATAAALLAGLAGAAQAHTGHGTHSLFEGLVHPFGLDHLLAMVAVGVWSVSALPPGKAWWGPATFLAALVVSAALGAAGVTVPYLEHAISLSVVLFGLMLVFANKAMPVALGLGLVAAASSLHGLAHGSETPETGFAGYAAGFLLTTAALHIGGVLVGLGVRRTLAERAGWALGGFGAALSVAGVYLFGQLAA
ncbi:MAG: HupE/UreJ family protein [Hydrogenophaga sp.]|uniref:HupE/UreJ family protein n=1 Tax=Hydrogenophaga sp. TaxID=1904254 RepID=UPI00271777C7|nr:HupE/UreJ family protein [Hydrogenophaga sp.]MDO9480573.1 HupE/UreJ family protein [Hydrogenophaga sp.]MDP2220441.1 HupE/UreJ family protein [Hydrogenophaga sp.]MDP3343837.1 HupE/UreJ family protein [Hydrogenophaga sp.]MDP3808334.1 HupE/UreJ family protein [Hydrogenophaga sp.]